MTINAASTGERMLRRPWWPARGQSLVEFALIAPLLFAMMFILVELGIVFSIYVGLTNSAREAARAGVAYQYPDPGAFMGQSTTTARATVDAGRKAVMDAAIVNTLNPIMDKGAFLAQNPSPFSYSPDPPADYDLYRYGSYLNVTLQYQHQLFFNLLGPNSITVRASSKMRLEPGGHVGPTPTP